MDFCDRCNKEDCEIIYKHCGKLDKPYIAEGETYYYAWNCGFCKKCISIIKNFDFYKPNNT